MNEVKKRKCLFVKCLSEFYTTYVFKNEQLLSSVSAFSEQTCMLSAVTLKTLERNTLSRFFILFDDDSKI